MSDWLVSYPDQVMLFSDFIATKEAERNSTPNTRVNYVSGKTPEMM